MALLRYIIHLIAALVFLIPSLAEAYDVLIVQSSRNSAFEEALKGFRSLRRGSERVIVLSDYADTDIVRIVREDQPRMVLALGDRALRLSRNVRHTPVISLLALELHNSALNGPNVTGVGMFIPSAQYLSICHGMKARRVGVVYHSSHSAAYLRQARQDASRLGIELVQRAVRAPQQTMAQLTSLAGKVDAIWMLPDAGVVTRESMEAFFRFSQQNHVPLISFAGAYLRLGAAAVLELDRVDMGRQAAELAGQVLSPGGAGVKIRIPRRAILKTNDSVLHSLGISLSQPGGTVLSIQD